jgi:phospholipase C
VVQDHTSLTAFIERKWNLPAMTFRDANAHPMTDYFDFRKPAFARPPRLKPAPGLAAGLAKCHAAGLNPPLPPGT